MTNNARSGSSRNGLPGSISSVPYAMKRCGLPVALSPGNRQRRPDLGELAGRHVRAAPARLACTTLCEVRVGSMPKHGSHPPSVSAKALRPARCSLRSAQQAGGPLPRASSRLLADWPRALARRRTAPPRSAACRPSCWSDRASKAHVTGTAATLAPSGTPYVLIGLAWGARIQPVRVRDA
jgi:hypothetical protein